MVNKITVRRRPASFSVIRRTVVKVKGSGSSSTRSIYVPACSSIILRISITVPTVEMIVDIFFPSHLAPALLRAV